MGCPSRQLLHSGEPEYGRRMPPKRITPILVPRPQVYTNSPLSNFLLADLPQHLKNIFEATTSEQHIAAIQRLRLVVIQLIRINSFACTQLQSARRALVKICKTNPPGAVYCPLVCPPQFGQASHAQQLKEIETALSQLYGESNILQYFLAAATLTGKYQEVGSRGCCGIGPTSRGGQASPPPPTPPPSSTPAATAGLGQTTRVIVHSQNIKDEVCDIE